MARQRKGMRVLGPYEERGGREHRIILVEDGGKRHPRLYPTLEQAIDVVNALNEQIGAAPIRTISTALTDYEAFLLEEAKNKQSSVNVTMWRLRPFFAPAIDLPLVRLDAAAGRRLYEAYCKRPTRYGRPPSDTTQLNTLEEAKTFGDWCAYDRHWIPTNPLATISGTGKRTDGKEKLRLKEARAWMRAALVMAARGGTDLERAVAAMLTLLLALRECEVLRLGVRDVDEGGAALQVVDTKTAAGERLLEVPSVLGPMLVALTRDKPATARVFPHASGWVTDQVKRICRAAEVPEVGSQSMRGLHSTLARGAGVAPHAVAKSLGHASYAITKKSYVEPGTHQSVDAKQVLTVLDGGRA